MITICCLFSLTTAVASFVDRCRSMDFIIVDMKMSLLGFMSASFSRNIVLSIDQELCVLKARLSAALPLLLGVFIEQLYKSDCCR